MPRLSCYHNARRTGAFRDWAAARCSRSHKRSCSNPRLAEKRGEMMAICGLGAVVGPTIGPVLGGWIIDNATWQMLFYFKLPLCMFGIILAWFVLGPTPKEERGAHDIDWVSFAAMVIGLASLQYVLSRGQREDWFDSSTIVVLGVVTVVALAYFIWQQWRAPHPFVNLHVFRSVSFSIGSVITVVSGFGMYGVNLVTPLFFQGPLALSAYNAGLYLVQGAVATAISMILVGELTKRIDSRVVIALGLALFVVGAWMMGDLNAGAGLKSCSEANSHQLPNVRSYANLIG